MIICVGVCGCVLGVWVCVRCECVQHRSGGWCVFDVTDTNVNILIWPVVGGGGCIWCVGVWLYTPLLLPHCWAVSGVWGCGYIHPCSSLPAGLYHAFTITAPQMVKYDHRERDDTSELSSLPPRPTVQYSTPANHVRHAPFTLTEMLKFLHLFIHAGRGTFIPKYMHSWWSKFILKCTVIVHDGRHSFSNVIIHDGRHSYPNVLMHGGPQPFLHLLIYSQLYSRMAVDSHSQNY